MAGDSGSQGRSDHALDEKGRLVVPASYRKGLGEHFTLSINPADRCLALYSEANWQHFCDRLDQAPRNRERRQFERFLAERTVEGASCDAQGRLLIPGSLREYAGIERETVIVGTQRRIEVWAKELYADNVMRDDAAQAYSEQQGLV